MRHPLLNELERYLGEKHARVEGGEGCPILLAIELSSAVNALEGIGVSGSIQLGGETVEIGKRSEATKEC